MTEVRRIRVRDGNERNDLEVRLPPSATVEVLADELGATGKALSVDGRTLASWHSLDQAGVFDGVLLEIEDPQRVDKAERPVVVIDQLAGLPGGVSRLLPSGRLDFSSSPASDDSFYLDISESGDVTVHPGVSPVVIDNVRIAHPTPLTDGILNVGASRYAVGQLPPSGIPSDLPISRKRARSAPESTARSVSPPVLPRFESAQFSAVWILPIPIVLLLGGLGMGVDRGFFALMAAVLVAVSALALAQWMTIRTEMRSQRELTRRVVGRFEADVVAMRRSVERDLRRANPAIPELARAARGEDAGSWDRRRGDPDFAHVAVGYGELAWSVPVESDVELSPLLQQVVENNSLLTGVPIIADLTKGSVGIVGPRDMVLPCARALTVTLATQSPASDVRFSLVADKTRLADWDWLKWLPQLHLTHPIALSSEETDQMVSSWRTPGSRWLQVGIVDLPKWATGQISLLNSVANEPGDQALIIMADEVADLPECETVVVIDADGMSTVTTGGATHRFVSPAAAAEVPTDTIARGAASLHRTFGEDRVGASAPRIRAFDIECRRLDAANALIPPPIPPMPPVSEKADDRVDIAAPQDVIDLRRVVDRPRRSKWLFGRSK